MTVMAARAPRRPPEPTRTLLKLEAQPDWGSYVRGGNRIGSATAHAVLVEFADFECPACRALDKRLMAIRQKYPNDFAIVYRHYPLAMHRFAEQAAVASECAAHEGRFTALHDSLFAHPDSIGLKSWRKFATGAGVRDSLAFDRCLSDSSVAARVESDRRAGDSLGVRGTPTVLINGVKFTGVPTTNQLDSLVQAALRAPVPPR